MRQFILILLNFSLPFLLFALRNWYWRYKLTKAGNPTAKIPQWNKRNVLRLLGYGLLLLVITLFTLRTLTPTDEAFHGNEATTRDY